MAQYQPSKANRRANDEQPAQPGRAEAVMMRRLMLERGFPLNCHGYMPPALTTAEAAADLVKLIESEKTRNDSKLNKTGQQIDLAYFDKVEKPKELKQSGRVSAYEFITEDELKEKQKKPAPISLAELNAKDAARKKKDAARKRLARQMKAEMRPADIMPPVNNDERRIRKNERRRLARKALRASVNSKVNEGN